MFFTSKRSIKSYICLLLLMCGDFERLPGSPNDLDLQLRKKGFSLFHQNVRGLFKKFDLVSDLLGNSNIIDILTLSETHIRSTGKVSVMKMLRVIHFLSLKCKTDSWGGFGLYASNQYDFKRREDLKNANLGSIWIEIFPKKSKSFSVCSNY